MKMVSGRALSARAKRRSLVGAVLLLAGTVAAHECWLAPRRYVVPVGTTQYLDRCVGEDFAPEPWAAGSRQLRGLWHLAPGYTAEQPAAAAASDDTLRTTLRFEQAGTHVVALRSTESLINLEAPRFNAYLHAEGLDGVLAQRKARGELALVGREGYSRCLKTLVRAGARPVSGAPAAPADTCWRRVLGLPLELVPEQDPYSLRVGAQLTLRLLIRGKPAVGQLVQVWHQPPATTAKATPVPAPLRLRTDLSGRLRFRLPAARAVLVSCVRMTPHARRDSADWQSTWSSLTFGGTAH